MNIKDLNEVDIDDDWTLLQEDEGIEMIDFGSDNETDKKLWFYLKSICIYSEILFNFYYILLKLIWK